MIAAWVRISPPPFDRGTILAVPDACPFDGFEMESQGVGRSFPDEPFERSSQHRRLRIDGAYARARVTFKAARFRASASLRLVQLRAASRCPAGNL
jgi:hypothetical protein